MNIYAGWTDLIYYAVIFLIVIVILMKIIEQLQIFMDKQAKRKSKQADGKNSDGIDFMGTVDRVIKRKKKQKQEEDKE